MAANWLGAAGQLLTGVVNSAETLRELGNRWHEADSSWEEFLRQLERLKEKKSQWNELVPKYGLAKNETLTKTLDNAQDLLEKELEKMRMRGKDETLSKVREALFPSLIGRSINTAIKAFDDVQKHLEEQNQRRIAAQRNALAQERMLGFTKRDWRYVRLVKTEQRVLNALLDPQGHKLILLHGRSGTGKSTLARYIALRIESGIDMPTDDQASSPEPAGDLLQTQLSMTFHQVVFLECSMDSGSEEGFVQRKPEIVLRELRRKLVGWMEDGGGVEPDEVEASLQCLLHKRKILIILDNVWKPEFLQRVVCSLEGALNAKWLVTSQIRNLCHPLTYGPILIQMETVSPEDARKILVRHIKRSGDRETIDTIPEHVQGLADELIEKADANLLAIACLATGFDPERIDDVEEWQEVRRGYFDLLSAKDTAMIFNVEHPGSYWAAMKFSFERLDEGVKRLLVLIGLCEATSVPQEVLEYLYGKASQRMQFRAFKAAKLDLEAKDLVQVVDKNCSIHDLLRKFVNDHDAPRELKRLMLTELSRCSTVSSNKGEEEILSTVIFLYFKKSFTAMQMDFKIRIHMDSETRWRKRYVLEPVMRLLVKNESDWTAANCRYTRQVFLKYVEADCVDEDIVCLLLRGVVCREKDSVMEFLARCFRKEPMSHIMALGDGIVCTCRHVTEQVVHSRLVCTNGESRDSQPEQSRPSSSGPH